MKNLLIILIILLTTSCHKKAFVVQSELNGTWENRLSLSKNDKVIISNDSICTWYNYRNTFKTKTFLLKYNLEKSHVTLYEDGCKMEQIKIMKNRNGNLLFTANETNTFSSENGTQSASITYTKR